MLDVNSHWVDYDILIYSPTITTGISFDIENHFYSIYLYICDNSAGTL